MMTRPKKAAVALTLLAAAGLLYFMVMPVSVVRAALGSRLGDVRDASTATFDFDDMDDFTPYVIETPVIFEYGTVGPDADSSSNPLRFTLPEARLVWLSQSAGVVYGIKVTPQTEPLGLEAAYALCQEITAAVSQAPGWSRTAAPVLSITVLQDYYAGEPTASESRFATWHSGEDELSVSLRRTEEGGRDYPPGYPAELKASEDEFAVTVSAFSSNVLSKATDDMFRKRREMSTDSDPEPLPIQVWLNDPLRP